MWLSNKEIININSEKYLYHIKGATQFFTALIFKNFDYSFDPIDRLDNKFKNVKENLNSKIHKDSIFKRIFQK